MGTPSTACSSQRVSCSGELPVGAEADGAAGDNAGAMAAARPSATRRVREKLSMQVRRKGTGAAYEARRPVSMPHFAKTAAVSRSTMARAGAAASRGGFMHAWLLKLNQYYPVRYTAWLLCAIGLLLSTFTWVAFGAGGVLVLLFALLLGAGLRDVL